MKIEIQHADGSIETAVSPVQLQQGNTLIIDGNKADMDGFELSENQLIITINHNN